MKRIFLSLFLVLIPATAFAAPAEVSEYSYFWNELQDWAWTVSIYAPLIIFLKIVLGPRLFSREVGAVILVFTVGCFVAPQIFFIPLYVVVQLRVFYTPVVLAMGWNWVFKNRERLKWREVAEKQKDFIKYVALAFALAGTAAFTIYMFWQKCESCDEERALNAAEPLTQFGSGGPFIKMRYASFTGASACETLSWEYLVGVIGTALVIAAVQAFNISSRPEAKAPFAPVFLRWFVAWLLALATEVIEQSYFCYHHQCFL